MQAPTPPIIPVPRRSRRRWLWIGAFLLLVAATPFGFSLIGNWMLDRELEAIYREMDEEDPHWRWDEMIAQQRAAPPDAENAAVQLAKVAEMLKTPFVPLAPLERKPPRPANNRLLDADAALLRATLAKVGPDVLGEARKLKDMPRAHIPLEPMKNPPDRNGPEFLGMFEVMRLLAYDAMLRGDDGELGAAAESCLAILNAANAIGDYPTLMAHLVHRAGQVMGSNAIERLLGQGVLSEQSLIALQTALEREAAHNGLYPALRGERVLVDDFFMRLREGKTSVSEGYAGAGKGSAQAMLYDALPGLFLRGYPQQLRLVNEEVRASKLRGQEQLEAFRALETKIAAVPSYSPTFALPLSIAALAGGSRADEQVLRCAVIAVAAERFRLQHKRWPNDIAELVKNKLLNEIPIDPFDGQPLRWRRTISGIVIYSIGINQIDDTSRLDRNDTRVAGGDIGVVLWDPNVRHVEPIAVAKKK